MDLVTKNRQRSPGMKSLRNAGGGWRGVVVGEVGGEMGRLLLNGEMWMDRWMVGWLDGWMNG